ncbi:YadA-like family protein [Mitsuokella jalaludinii]|uniref:YadA-like family protein n=1 Tax=Mitsuokella jalaludinii TaxID=187979 RepID=UPI00384F2377
MNTVAFGTDTVSGAVLDDNGAYTNIIYKTNAKGRVVKDENGNPIELSREKMDARGNLAYMDNNGSTKSVTYTVSGGENHSYVLLQGEDGNTYIRDYRGNIRSAVIGDDGTVTVGDKPLTGVNLKQANAGANGYHILSNTNATVWGENSIASGEASTAFGVGSTAKAKNSLAALGGTVVESAENSAAIGKDAKANLADSVALGSGAVADRASGAKGYDMLTKGDTTNTSTAWVANANAIAVGNGSTLTRQITGVAAGSQDTDAVNVAQLKAAGFKVTTQNNGDISSSILNGDTLDFEGKDNAIVSTSKDSKTITVAVSKTPTFDSATFYNPTGSNNEKVTIANGQVSAFNGDQKKRAAVGVDNQGNGTLFLVNDDLSQAHLYTQSSKETGNDGITRMYYTSSTDNGGEVNGVHTIAVLDDGINYAGDNVKPNTSEKVVVKHKLNSTMDVTGGADTNNLAGGNIGVVATPAVEDDQGNITQKAKLELKLNKVLTGLNTVTAGSAKIGSAPSDTLKLTENGAVTEKTAPAGSYVTGLDNKDWNVDKPKYVSGRAATEDQLKAISDTIKANADAAASKHTEITVNDKANPTSVSTENIGQDGYGNYAGTENDNLLIAAKKDATSNKVTYNIKLNDQLAIGQKGEQGEQGQPGTPGKDGKFTVETSKGTTVVIGHDGEPGKDGKDGISVTGKNGADGVSITGPNSADGTDGKVGISGTDGKDAVSISGKGGFGHIGLTGPEGEKGKDGISIDITTGLKAPTLDSTKNVSTTVKDASGKETTIEQAPRIQYKNGNTTYEVATMDDGQKYAGDVQASDAKANAFSRKLNEQTNIVGGVKNLDALSTGNNVGVVSNGTDTLTIRLAKELTDLTSVTTVTKDAKGNKTSETVQDGNGITITPTTLGEGKSSVSLTDRGLSNGGNQITHVDSGLKDATGNTVDLAAASGDVLNNAVNVGDLQNVQKVASAHTAVTVNGSVEAPAVAADGKLGNYTDKEKGNLLLAQKKDTTTGKITYDLKLNDKVILGKDTSDGKDGQEGTIGLTGKDGLPGTDGKQGYSTIIIKTEKGQKGKDGKTGKENLGGTDITRIVYTDKDGSNPQTVATLSDGLKFAGDDISKTVDKKLNDTLQIRGDGTYDKEKNTIADDGNIKTSVDNGAVKVSLSDKINLHQDGSLTVGGGSTTGDDPIIIKHFDAGKLTVTGTDKDGKTPQSAAGDYVTGLDNKDWNVDKPEYVSGRAATEDQLKAISDTIKANADATASQHTEITVNDKANPTSVSTENIGQDGYGNYAGTENDNLLIAAKKDATSNKVTYNIKLNDQLAIGKNGTDGQDGKDGKDGKVTVETSKGTTVVIGHDGEPGKDGKDGVSVTGKNGADGVSITGPNGADGTDGKVGISGTDGKDAVSISGKGGFGHIGLTGPEGEKGKDGISIDITTGLKAPTLDSTKNVSTTVKDTTSGQETTIEQAPRIQYKSGDNTYEVATIDDGLKIGANAAAKDNAANPVSNKLNSTINIKGSEAKADHTYTDDNLTTTVEQDADGNTTVKVLMDQDITGNSVTVGKDSKDGEDGKAGYDGQEGSIGIAGKNGIDGKNGKQGITTTIIKTEKGQNGKDGEVGKQGAPGVDGKDITRIVYQNGQDGENGQGGKHVVATLDDGLKFVGDDGTATPVTKKLNDTLQIRGDGTYDATTKTNNGNIQTSVESGTIKVALNKDINLKQTGSLTVGGDQKEGSATADDPIVIKHFDDKTLDVIGVDKDGKPITSKEGKPGDYVTGLDNKDWDVSSPTYVSGRAATEDQLKKVSDAVNSAAATAGKHTVVTVEGGKDAGTTDYNGENLKLKVTDTNGQKTYDLKLNDNLSLGTVGKDGAKGTDGSVGLKGADGKSGIGLNGKDGISVIGIDGKNGVSITGSNGLNGKDGIDGKIAIGTPGKDGQPGKDAVSISGQNGIGHIGLTGQKGEDGKDGVFTDLSTTLGTATLDPAKNEQSKSADKVNADDKSSRIQYQTTVTDKDGKTKTVITHEVATMDDGQKYAGDFGDGALVKLNKTVNVKGNAKKEADLTDGNIGVVSSQSGDNGQLLIKLNKDLNLGDNGSVKMGNTTINNDGMTISKKESGKTTTVALTDKGLNNGGNKITNVVAGTDGTDAVNVSQLNDVKTLAGQHTTVEAGSKNITVKEGTNSTGGKNYTIDLAKDVAFGDAAKGDKTVAISGTNGTVMAGTGDNRVTVDGSKGQIVVGGDNGVKIGNIAEGDSSLTIYDKDGKATNQTDKAGMYVTNLDNKTWKDDGSYVSGRAATEDQLHQVESNVNKQIADVNTKIDKVDKHHTEVTVNGGTAAKADGSYTDGNLQLKQTTGEDGQKVYDLKLNDQLKVGQKGDAGKAGKDGNVTVETKGGTTVVIGHDGKDGKNGRDGLFVTGKDGKNGKSGVSITGPNGVAGRDGVDGKVGIAGKDGRDAVSIAGRDGVGHIGLTGPKGADGKDGAFTDLSTILGQATLDPAKNVKGKDGDAKDEKASRIHYETTVATKDGEKTVSHEVATMDDGMKYSGDSGSAAVKLNNNVQLYGGAKEYAAGDNIGVVVSQDGDNAKMQVKLAKDLKGIDSIDAKTVTTGNTTINNGGLTVKGDDKHKDITVQQGAVNMGGNKIEGVAPGRIAPDSTDAVNGSQLAQRDQAIGKLGGAINNLDRRVDRVGAGAAALAALHPQDFDPDDKWDFAVGYGNYRGANAAAVGAFYRPNEDTTLSVGGTVGGGENMVNAGVSFKFGQGNHVTNSRVAMAKEILALKDYVQKQDEKIEKLEALVGQQGTANAPKRRSILFPDVPENHWAYVYVKKLADRGLLEGYPDGEFKGTRTITRYEFAAIFSRALENGASVDNDMERMSEEFEPEIRELSLSRFRVDRVEGDDNDRHKIERVRVNDRDELVKQKNGEQKKRYRDVYGSVIEKDAPSDAVK